MSSYINLIYHQSQCKRKKPALLPKYGLSQYLLRHLSLKTFAILYTYADILVNKFILILGVKKE